MVSLTKGRTGERLQQQVIGQLDAVVRLPELGRITQRYSDTGQYKASMAYGVPRAGGPALSNCGGLSIGVHKPHKFKDLKGT